MQENRQPACFPLGRGKVLPRSKAGSGRAVRLWLRPCREHSGQPRGFADHFPRRGRDVLRGPRQASPYNPGTTVQEQVSSGYIWEKLRKSPSNICRTVFSKFFSCRVDMISCSFLFSPNKGPARKFPCGTEFFMAKV